jgi:hypothetical protein
MDSPDAKLPPSKELRFYDVILFSKRRFENEIHDGSDKFVGSLPKHAEGRLNITRDVMQTMSIQPASAHISVLQEQGTVHVFALKTSTLLH